MRTLLGLICISAACYGQQNLRMLSLANSVNSSTTTVSVYSPSLVGLQGGYIYLDSEAMQVNQAVAAPASTGGGTGFPSVAILTVVRGILGTAASSHTVGVTVWAGQPSQFVTVDPGGFCVSTQGELLNVNDQKWWACSMPSSLAAGFWVSFTTVLQPLVLQESCNVRDFGAVGNGSVDDATAFSAAIAACSSIQVSQGTYLIGSNLNVPSTTQMVFLGGGVIAPSTGVTVSINGDIQAGNYQIFGGLGHVTIGDTKSVTATWWPGDIGAEINAAIVSLAPSCGEIHIPRGAFSFANPIQANDTVGCHIIGSGGINAGSNGVTRITYTGTGTTAISAQSSLGFQLSQLQLITSSPSFTGSWVDLRHSLTAGTDAAYAVIDRILFDSTNGGIASIGIDIDKAIIIRISDNFFFNYTLAVSGIAGSGDYSNSITLTNNTFLESSSSGAAISGPGQAWAIIGNTFEMGGGAGSSVIGCPVSTGAGTNGVSFLSNWVGDWTNNVTGAVNLHVCGSGWVIGSNNLALPFLGTCTEVAIGNGSSGIQITGNLMNTGACTTAGINIGSSVADLAVNSNQWTAVSTFLVGTPTSGTIVDPSGKTSIYGSVGFPGALPVASGGTGTTTPGIVAGSNMSVTGTWPNQTVGFAGGAVSVASLAATGQVSGSTLVSSVATGTAPFTVSSTTPVANLTAQNHPEMLTQTGTLLTNSRIVLFAAILTSGTTTVAFTTGFSNSTSFICSASDRTAPNAVQIVNASATSINLTGTGSDIIQGMCAGN